MITGYRYAEMGYTACFEPAMLPANARQAHMELADTPLLDKGAFVMLGSDDFLLRAHGREDATSSSIKDYIAWTMHAAQAIAVKVVNPGGISAFKFNQRKLDLDEKHVYYGITPRDIILTLARGLLELGVTHPLHVHGCNLGIPGNVETTLATIRATEGLPLHLTHIQFHSYGTEGDRHFSSGAAADRRPAQPSIRTSRSTSARSCSARRARRPATACASTTAPRTPTRSVGWSWTSSATPAAASSRSAIATRATCTRCSGRSGSRRSSCARIPGASS